MNGDVSLPAGLRNDTSALRGRIEDFLYLEVFLIAEFQKTRHQRPPRTASIFFLSVSALNGFTM